MNITLSHSNKYPTWFLRIPLLPEIILVTVAAVFIFTAIGMYLPPARAAILQPCTLVMAALIPTFIKRRKLTDIHLPIEQPALSLKLLGLTCLVLFPLTFLVLFSIRYLALPLPLAPAVITRPTPAWLLYQFMYVAVAEEIFFRGYLQGNLLRLVTDTRSTFARFWPTLTIIISAAAFAAAHAALSANPLALVTFLPGLVFGWLFLRTRSLLAPILFHGLANTFYALIIYFMGT